MIKKPLFFPVLALVVLGIALSMPMQVLWLYDHPWEEFELAMAKLTMLNWAFMLMSCYVSYLLFTVNPRSVYFIIPYLLLGILNNTLVGLSGVDFVPMQTSVASAALVLIFMPLLKKDFATLLLDPRKRWWLRAPRITFTCPVLFESRLISQSAQLFDISRSGAFIKFPSEENFTINQRMDLNIKLDQLHQLHCQAQVIRVNSHEVGTYPAGIGVKFMPLTSHQAELLDRFISAHELT